MPGPPPKKDAERTRNNVPESGAARHGQLRPVTIPNADRKNWHPRALAWFESLKDSGQADYYQASDWAMAKVIADYLTLWYERPRAMDMANIFSITTLLISVLCISQVNAWFPPAESLPCSTRCKCW